MTVSGPNGGQNPLQKSLSRRVSFKDTDIDIDIESQTDSRGRRFFGSICNACCLWISFILGLFLFLLILVGSLYYSFLRSNLPDVRLQRLDVNRIDLVSSDRGMLLTADFFVLLNATNLSEKAELVYNSMMASVSVAGIRFGLFRVEDVRQPPHNTSALRVTAAVKDKVVEDAAAKELQDNSKLHMLVIDVEVRGRIDMVVGGKKTNGFAFKIECDAIDQSEIDNGHAPRCNSKLATQQ